MHITAIEFIWRQAKDFISWLRLRLPRIANYSVVGFTLWNATWRDIALRSVEVIDLTCKFENKELDQNHRNQCIINNVFM